MFDCFVFLLVFFFFFFFFFLGGGGGVCGGGGGGGFRLFVLTSPGRTGYFPASILYKSIAGPDGPLMARYRFIKKAYWVLSCKLHRVNNA